MAEVPCDHATCIYPGAERPAVDVLNLAISGGEFVVMVGPSGCGKIRPSAEYGASRSRCTVSARTSAPGVSAKRPSCSTWNRRDRHLIVRSGRPRNVARWLRAAAPPGRSHHEPRAAPGHPGHRDSRRSIDLSPKICQTRRAVPKMPASGFTLEQVIKMMTGPVKEDELADLPHTPRR